MSVIQDSREIVASKQHQKGLILTAGNCVAALAKAEMRSWGEGGQSVGALCMPSAQYKPFAAVRTQVSKRDLGVACFVKSLSLLFRTVRLNVGEARAISGGPCHVT